MLKRDFFSQKTVYIKKTCFHNPPETASFVFEVGQCHDARLHPTLAGCGDQIVVCTCSALLHVVCNHEIDKESTNISTKKILSRTAVPWAPSSWCKQHHCHKSHLFLRYMNCHDTMLDLKAMQDHPSSKTPSLVSGPIGFIYTIYASPAVYLGS